MSDPQIDPGELGTYLGDDSIDTDRATLIIADAQAACETVVNPVPAGKLFVLRRVAARAYLAGGGQARGYQLQMAGVDSAESGPWAGVYLTEQDRSDLAGDDVDEQPVPDAFTIRVHAQTPYSSPYSSPYRPRGWW